MLLRNLLHTFGNITPTVSIEAIFKCCIRGFVFSLNLQSEFLKHVSEPEFKFCRCCVLIAVLIDLTLNLSVLFVIKSIVVLKYDFTRVMIKAWTPQSTRRAFGT
jgi:hypothetical protein